MQEPASRGHDVGARGSVPKINCQTRTRGNGHAAAILYFMYVKGSTNAGTRQTLRSFRRRIERLAADRTSGASELLAESLALLLDLSAALEHGCFGTWPSILHPEPIALTDGEGRSRLLALLRALQCSQPSMAPILNLGHAALQLAKMANDCQGLTKELINLARHWKQRGKQAQREIAVTLQELLRGARHVVTYSRSSTVLAGLRACRRSGLRFRISISQGSPQMEGVAAARALAQIGFEVTLTTDAGLFGMLEEADALLIGGDAIIRAGIVNKIGTRALVETGRRHKVPVYSICGHGKLLPSDLEPLFCIRCGEGSELLPRKPKSFRSSHRNLHLLNPYFDITPLRFIARVIPETRELP